MKTVLEQMWYDYSLILEFKKELINKGYIYKDVLFLEGMLYELNRNIELESFNVMTDLLRKTYFRLLVKINKGHNLLLDIINKPSSWELSTIEQFPEAWIRDDVLVFTTETKCAVFNKASISDSFKYIDNKWQ